MAPLGQSDHVCIIFAYLICDTEKEEKTEETKLDYFRGNYDEIRRELRQTNWENDVEPLNDQVESSLNTLSETPKVHT